VVERVGPSDVNVLVRGESGTGKELVARALHAVSSRKGGPLVAVNCAALVDSLLLSELFGHEKGAFTGAHERRRGRFELAHGGTLFLDEIGDVSPAVQAALLRVLQERTFERIGGRETIHVDVRVVAATNRDLATMVRSGTFREDLYYRLNELVIALPPLRERAADVPLLAELFLARIGEERGEPPKRLSNRALRLAVDYSWPGNVRQLENVLRAATLFADADVVDVEHLDIQGIRTEPDGAASAVHARPVVQGDEVELCYARLRSGEVTLRDLKKDLERELLERALGECDGNISRAAALLGMKRPRVSQLVKEYGLRSWGDES
jgi:sigma-54 specific flagellar transcriptional regulator A